MRNNIFNTKIIGAQDVFCSININFKNYLKTRWTAERVNLIREAISLGKDLPEVFPLVEVEYRGKKVLYDDLRGVDLSNMNIDDYDLSYCALDYANFNKSNLVGTHLQYSRLLFASFNSVKMQQVQASPVDARNANFSKSVAEACFVGHSDFSDAIVPDGFFDRCDAVEAKFNYSSGLSEAKIRVFVGAGRQPFVKRKAPVASAIREVIRKGFEKFVPERGGVIPIFEPDVEYFPAAARSILNVGGVKPQVILHGQKHIGSAAKMGGVKKRMAKKHGASVRFRKKGY